MGEIVAINQICNDIDNVAFVGYQIFEPERNIKRGHAMIRVPVSVNNKASMRAPTNSNQIAFHQLLSPLRTILLDTRKITAFLFGIDNIYGCYNGHGGIFFGLFLLLLYWPAAFTLYLARNDNHCQKRRQVAFPRWY